jgi:hypothetical protein
MVWRGAEWEGEFPSLGYEVADWIEERCVIPDGEHMGEPFQLTDEQLRYLVHHYRLKPDANQHSWQTAWQYTRSLLVRPQKWGKAPLTSAMICAEAAAPVVFAGWDANGEPVGRPWPTPIIQVTAYSEDQTDNIWKVLRPMIDLGPLADAIPDTGETRINLPGSGWIEPVTSKALSRLGARITFAPQDEVGTWTSDNMRYLADTQYRGLSGTGGRAALTTNAWNLADNSVAQQIEEERDPTDFVDYVDGRMAGKSYANKRDRAQIHRHVYGDSAVKLDRSGVWVSGWVNLDRIEIDAEKMLKRDPEQAMRFYGNINTMGSGAWLPDMHAWASKLSVRDRPKSGPVCLGFDGSDSNDWTGIRLETLDQHQFTPRYGVDLRPTIWKPKLWNGKVPRDEVMTAFEQLFRDFDIVRAYLDPPLWGSEIAALQGRYSDKVVIEWPTYRPKPMHFELERFHADIMNASSSFTHDDDGDVETNIRNAVKRSRPGETYILGKPADEQKIDLTMSSTLAHAAVLDAIASGLGTKPKPVVSTTYYAFN